jgi:hypothetical protein
VVVLDEFDVLQTILMVDDDEVVQDELDVILVVEIDEIEERGIDDIEDEEVDDDVGLDDCDVIEVEMG